MRGKAQATSVASQRPASRNGSDEDEAVGERLDAEGPQEVGVGELRDEGELVVELGEAQRAGCPRPSQQQRGRGVAPAGT